MSVHTLTYLLSSEGFANTLACINKPYCYIKFALYCMDLVQYKPNGWPESNLYTFLFMKFIYFISGLDNELYI